MAIPRKLLIIFIFFYFAIILYLVMFFLIPDFQDFIIKGREDIKGITEGSNYIWALVISFSICLIGSMSVGFPVPFPFVLLTLSNSILIRYNFILGFMCWMELLGISIIGGLGAFLGEFSSYMIGKGARIIAEKKESRTLDNVKGFGKLVLNNPKRIGFYVFLGAATPIPDDILIISISMLTDKEGNQLYPFLKLIIPGWLVKNITTLFYCFFPLFIYWGITASGLEPDITSTIITEIIMLFVTITIMFFIIAFDWNKYFDNIKKEK